MTTLEQWIDINASVLHDSADRLKVFLEADNKDGAFIQSWAIIKQINSFWEFVERRRKFEPT